MTSQVLGTDLAAMRRLNDDAVLTTLWDAVGPVTASQLAAATSLSRTTVETVLSGLVDAGLVTSEQLRPARAGRPARGYRFASNTGISLGIDVGPHGISGVAGDLRGTTTAPHRRVDRDLVGGGDATSAIVDLVTELLRESAASADELAALTVGIPGIVDANGHPIKTTVVPDWLTSDIDAQLRQAFPRAELRFDNDTKLAALAELEFGTVGPEETAVLLRIGNRISAASIVDGRIARGAHGAAGEIGALGRVGWPEALQRLAARAPLGIEQLLADSRPPASGEDDLIAAFAADIADGLGALVLAIDPHVVVVSSSFPDASARLAEALRSELTKRSLFLPDVRTSTLGATAPCIGALAVSVSAVRTRLFSRDS